MEGKKITAVGRRCGANRASLTSFFALHFFAFFFAELLVSQGFKPAHRGGA